jgi:translation initiation factor eIF-2B subunit gamma
MTLYSSVQEFQAVVYCGQGSRLYPFTDKENHPKALLSVAGKPLIHYPLEWLEQEGIFGKSSHCISSHTIESLDVIVVAHKSSGPKLAQYFSKNYLGTLKLDLVLLEEEDAGSFDALYILKDKIRVHYLVQLPTYIFLERFYYALMRPHHQYIV